MQIHVATPDEYIAQIPLERQVALNQLRNVILENLPQGFEETISYGMIGYVVPHRLYPKGYHCDTTKPLPFMSIASQKQFVGVYHMGIYSDVSLLNWFTNEYPKYCTAKLDMGRSCMRFKKIDQIPYPLIGALASKITPAQWIEVYEKSLKK